LINRDAIIFAHQFLERAENFTDKHAQSQFIKIGPKSLKLKVNRNSYFGELIAESFIISDMENLDFELHIWDSGFEESLPEHGWSNEWQYTNKPINYEETKPFRIFLDNHQGMIYVYDTINRKGAIWLRKHTQLDIRCFVAPFKLMLSWMAMQFGGEIIHASAIEIEKKGFIFPGPSGSGKSTLAIYAALSNHKILSDDCILHHDQRIYAIYTRAKISRENPLLDFNQIDYYELKFNFNGKYLVDLANLQGNFLTSSRLDFIVLPIIAHMSHIAKISSWDTNTLMIDQSLREIFGGTYQNEQNLKQIIEQTEKYRLALSGGLERDFQKLFEIL
jgi:hypothetical protein